MAVTVYFSNSGVCTAHTATQVMHEAFPGGGPPEDLSDIRGIALYDRRGKLVGRFLQGEIIGYAIHERPGVAAHERSGSA